MLLAATCQDIVPAVTVEVGDGEHEVEPPETRIGADRLEPDASWLGAGRGAAEYNRHHEHELHGLHLVSPLLLPLKLLPGCPSMQISGAKT